MNQPVLPSSDFGPTKLRVIHIALLLAALGISAVMILLPAFLGRHLKAGSGTGLFRYATGGTAMVMMIVAVSLLRRKVPTRSAGETVSDYWSRQSTVSAAVATWTVLDGAATVAAMGYLMSGGLIPLVGMLAGLVGLIILSPARLAGG